MGEPLVGGWGASGELDGDSGQFCPANGETFNIPVELAEARYGFLIDQYAFHNQEGGAGEFRGGKGVILDYRITADEAFLTYATSRYDTRPWGMNGGHEGTHNYVELLRNDGKVERHHMLTSERLEKDEVVRLYTGTGGGFGDPKKRDRMRVLNDVKNGYISKEEAYSVYGI